MVSFQVKKKRFHSAGIEARENQNKYSSYSETPVREDHNTRKARGDIQKTGLGCFHRFYDCDTDDILYTALTNSIPDFAPK